VFQSTTIISVGVSKIQSGKRLVEGNATSNKQQLVFFRKNVVSGGKGQARG